MSTPENLQTKNPAVMLVEPNIERDAPLSVQWLNGELGEVTQASMGVAEEDNKPTTLGDERERIRDFIERQDQFNWMIQYQGKTVGSVWVDLEQVGSVPAPAIHIMIGDPEVRGMGIGFAATSTALEYLADAGFSAVYSRHLTRNNGASHLLKSQGFTNLGLSYNDDDGLEWQNVEKLK